MQVRSQERLAVLHRHLFKRLDHNKTGAVKLSLNRLATSAPEEGF